MPQMTPAIWVISSDARWGQSSGMRWPKLFTKAQQVRLERLRQANMLFGGQHREYFLTEDRSQFYFPFLRLSNGRMQRMYIQRNLLKLVSLVSAALLLGQESLIRCEDEIQQDVIDDFKDDSGLHAILLQAAISCSYEAETFLEAQHIDGQVYLQQIPTEEIFPVGQMRPNWQYPQYDRYQFTNVGDDKHPLWLCLITHIMPKLITRECWQCKGDAQGGPDELNNPVDLTYWQPDPTLKERQPTGIQDNTVTYIPNMLQKGMPVSDYDGNIDAQDKVNAKETQLSRVLAKHADPKMYVPESMFDDTGNVDANYDVFPVRSEADKPGYLTWEAQLDAALKDRDQAVLSLMIETETPPTLAGLDGGAAAEAFKTVRLRSMSGLNKAARKALYWKAGIRRAVSTCLDMMQTLPGTRFDRSPISVELRDGIPVDAESQANVLATLKQAGLKSTESAVEELYNGDTEAVAKEMGRLDAEAAKAAPSVNVALASTEGGDAGVPANTAANGTVDQGGVDPNVARQIGGGGEGNVDDAMGTDHAMPGPGGAK